LPEPVEVSQKPWRQLAFVLGEAALSLVSGGVLFIIISRTSGPELLGEYALSIAWLMLFQGGSSFGIPEFIMRETGAHGRDAAGQVVHAMVLGLGTGLAAICVMLVLVRTLGYRADLVQAISIASLALIPAFLNTVCRGAFMAQRQMQVPFMAALVENAIMTSASLYLLSSGHGAVSLMIALVGSKAASASIATVLAFRGMFPALPPLDLRVLMETARTVFSFGMGNLFGILSRRINTIMVSLWVSIEAVGHFAAATKVMEFCLIAPDLFSQLLLTRIAHSFVTRGNRDPNRFGAWFEVLFALVVPACVGVWVFAGLILETLFGKPFGDALWILRILMIYVLTETADGVMSVILKAAHRQRQDAYCVASNLVTNVMLNLALLPVLGAIGTAIGRVGGGFASATLRHFLIARELTRMDWVRFAWKPALTSAGAGSVCYVLLDGVRPAWVLLFYIALILASLRMFSKFSFSVIKDVMSSPPGPE
jgi:O-antigen/teichoic acid export membrane protein